MSALAFPVVRSGHADPGVVLAEPRSSESVGRPLSRLVHEYLETADADQAAQMLAEILRDPGATVEALETMLRAGREYGQEPIGIQPGVPIHIRDLTYQYGLYVPSTYSPAREYALVVCLHGAGFTGDAYLERWQTRLGEDYILACPTFLQGAWWTRRAEDLVLATIRAVQGQYRVNADRIFLTGMSNGGIGALLIGMHHAPLFAGLSPMAGGLDDVLLPFLGNLRNTPLYLIHGKRDQVMPVELSRTIATELARMGYPYVYREHDRVHPVAGGHYFPREELPDLVAWLDARRRDPYPKHLTVLKDASHLGSFGWVRIDATDRIASFTESLTESQDELVTQRIYATLDAHVTAPNRIEMVTTRVGRFTVFLNRELVDFSEPITVITNGRERFHGRVSPSPETLLRDARQRRDRAMLFAASVTVTVSEEP